MGTKGRRDRYKEEKEEKRDKTLENKETSEMRKKREAVCYIKSSQPEVFCERFFLIKFAKFA